MKSQEPTAPITMKQLADMVNILSKSEEEIYSYFPTNAKFTTKEEDGKLYIRAKDKKTIWWVEIDKEAWKNKELKFVKNDPSKPANH